MEVFAGLGIILSILQITFGKLRRGPSGILCFGLLWLFWHDLVISGGRFTAYQMDLLLLDAAPLCVLSASGLVPTAATTFGFRWLLSRLYMGTGAVKLLSCDASWRDLSAVHWHFQSQPLPNPIGGVAFLHLPDGVTHPLTLAVLVAEMAAPFLFLAPSRKVRVFAFVLNVGLMGGIALFGNFGPLQALLVIIGLSLLDDLPTAPGMQGCNQAVLTLPENETGREEGLHVDDDGAPFFAVSLIACVVAAAAAYWAVGNVQSTCDGTLAVAPLVYDLIVVGAAIACLPLLQGRVISSIVSMMILAGSAVPMAAGLGVSLPYAEALDTLNIGSVPYGLFAIMTGVGGGRPVAVIEGAMSQDGPWTFIPLLYQINNYTSALPLCFPHFPRLDWTLWFVPLGENGEWIPRFLRGIAVGDSNVLGLLDRQAFHDGFPNGPPEFVRIVSKTMTLGPDGNSWQSASAIDSVVVPKMTAFPLKDIGTDVPNEGLSSWSSLPLLRDFASSGRPEHFVWGCLAVAESGRRCFEYEDHRDESSI